ncbi:MAG: V-type ATP synthase subunit I, partial [Clostridiales bacterium]|nr:V-type ATP synthase subunit I [Clostridiales bacterium]
MKRLRLAAVKREREELLKKLMLLGCVEINEPEGILADEALAELLDKGTSSYGESKSDYESLNLALELLNSYAPEKTKILAPKPEVDIGDILNEDSLEKTLAKARELIKKEEDIRALQAEESRIKSACEALQPWLQLDLPLEVSETKSCFVTLGGIPSVTDMAQFKTELYDLAYGIQLFEISKDKDMNYILVLAMKQDKNEVSNFLASRGFMESTAKNEYEGTAAENLDVLKKRLSQLEQKRQTLNKEIISAAFLREDFKLCADRLMTKVGAEENGERLLHTEETVVFEGWFPAKREQELIKTIESLGGAWEIREPLEKEYPQVPVKLTNGRFSRPLNMVTNMYSLPMYGSVDPNPRMAFFFILFYGIMMADMAYGLLMILASVIVLKKKRPAEGVRDFFELMFECGVSTIFWGALTGSFFGDTPYQIAKIINPET